jgi:hypothetical protein
VLLVNAVPVFVDIDSRDIVLGCQAGRSCHNSEDYSWEVPKTWTRSWTRFTRCSRILKSCEVSTTKLFAING